LVKIFDLTAEDQGKGATLGFPLWRTGKAAPRYLRYLGRVECILLSNL
jgi:hypothetical protein